MKKTENVTHNLYVAKVIKELTEHYRWKFSGTFQTFTSPPLLTKLVQLIVIGPRENINYSSRRDLAENVSKTVTQMIYQNFKRKQKVIKKF